MDVLIAGASGFIGTELVKALEQAHTITVLGRSITTLEKYFAKTIDKATWQDLDKLDAKKFDLVINLCGSNIGERRWSPKVRKELINSRVTTW